MKGSPVRVRASASSPASRRAQAFPGGMRWTCLRDVRGLEARPLVAAASIRHAGTRVQPVIGGVTDARKEGFMKARAVIPALALAGALAATVGASARPQATSIQIRTVLNAGQEVPSPTGAVSNAGGTFSATVTKSDTGASVSWQLSFTGLTGDAIAAHIHTGAIGSPGPVVLALCGPCSSPASGTGTVPQAVVDAIQAGTAYVNVH